MMDHALNFSGGLHRDVTPASEIFVVDDDENMRDLLEHTLELAGYPVTSFADGDSFLHAASTTLPICVFLDVVMPRRSGLEVLKELRSRQLWMPTILISARDDIPLVVEAMRNGAHDFLTKPFDRQAPAARVREALELWTARALESAAAPARASETGEWVRLTPEEKGALALMRLMDIGQG